MLVPCFAVALLAAVSTFDSNGAFERLSSEAAFKHRAIAKVREEFDDLLAIRNAETQGRTGERSLAKQEGTLLAAFDEARSAFDPDEIESLWIARQHVLDLSAHGHALADGEIDIAAFRDLADADERGMLTALEEVDRRRNEQFVADAGAVSRRSKAILLVVGAVLVAAVITTVVILRRLRRALYFPLRHLELGVEQFAVDGLGHRIEVEGDREFRSVAAVVNTMAARLEESLAELAHKAFHDPLTGLANRTQLERRLQRQLDASATSAAAPAGAVVVLDLDGFKAVNDALGHQAGDDVLVEVSRRLRATVRPGDLVARLGGDEFAVLLAEARSNGEVDSVVARLSLAIADPIIVVGRAIVLGCSAGAELIGDGASPLDLLRHADIALYAAKREGRGRLLQFEPQMEAVVQQRLALEAELRVALCSGQIAVVYQPVINLADLHVAGFEALARWHHPQRGVVGPDEFIPIAEATGLIVPLGKQVLDAACHQLAIWRTRPGHHDLAMGVNVSPNQLGDREFIEHVRSALRTSGIPASALVLEVTETVMADPQAVACLHELKQLGILVGLDDFGTGYSSLSYLQQLPIDILKIDKSFIDGIDTHPDRAVLVNTVLRMGRALRLRTVAEGIEDANQLELLQRLGCIRGQGYHLSHPLAVDDVAAFLDRGDSPVLAPVRRQGGSDLVAVRIGPVPASAATATLDYAEQVLDLVAASMTSSIDVSPGVLSLMRHYVDAWRGVAESCSTFTWEGFERVSVVRMLSSEWARISHLAAIDGGILWPDIAEPFRHAVTSAVLVVLASAEFAPDEHEPAALAQSGPRRPHELAAHRA